MAADTVNFLSLNFPKGFNVCVMNSKAGESSTRPYLLNKAAAGPSGQLTHILFVVRVVQVSEINSDIFTSSPTFHNAVAAVLIAPAYTPVITSQAKSVGFP